MDTQHEYMIQHLNYNKEASELLKDSGFNKFWRENQYLTLSDQVINAWQAGRNEKVEVEVHAVIKEYEAKNSEDRRNDTIEFVKEATTKIVSLYDELKKETSSLDLHLKIENINSVEFLFALEDENYFLNNLEDLYVKAAKIQAISSTDKIISIRFTSKGPNFDSKLLSDDGFMFTFQG